MSVMPASRRRTAHSALRTLGLTLGSAFVTTIALTLAGCGEKVVDASGGPSTKTAEETKGDIAKKQNLPKGLRPPKSINTQ